MRVLTASRQPSTVISSLHNAISKYNYHAATLTTIYLSISSLGSGTNLVSVEVLEQQASAVWSASRMVIPMTVFTLSVISETQIILNISPSRLHTLSLLALCWSWWSFVLRKLIAQHSSNLSLIIGGVGNINIDHNRLLALTTNILMDCLVQLNTQTKRNLPSAMSPAQDMPVVSQFPPISYSGVRPQV